MAVGKGMTAGNIRSLGTGRLGDIPGTEIQRARRNQFRGHVPTTCNGKCKGPAAELAVCARCGQDGGGEGIADKGTNGGVRSAGMMEITQG